MYRRNLGDQIRDIVEDAVDSCNFQDLNNKIKNTADRAIDEFNRATSSFGTGPNYGRGPGERPPYNGQYGGPGFGGPGFGGPEERQHQSGRYANYRRDREEQRFDHEFSKGRADRHGYEQPIYRQAMNNQPFYNRTDRRVRKSEQRPVGSVSGVLYIVFGSILAGGFGITAFVLLCILLATGFASTALSVLSGVFGVITLVSAGMITVGISQKKRVKRFKIYNELLEKTKACEIKRMAERVHKSERFVIRDLKKMMLLSMYKEGHFDKKQTCFIKDDVTYGQYLAAQESYEKRAKEEKEVQSSKEEKQQNEELRKAIEDGRAYIKAIRDANDDIPGEEISRKLDRLENIISKIFVCVEKHPEKLSEIRKFMEYYLPITIKLVNAYKEFDSQPIQGENITKSKQEIEDTLDTIDQAFENLLDSLYENEAMEVSSDISVLNTLFAQEGLTKKDFNLK